MNINFVRRRRLFYLISLVLILPGLISMALPGGLHPGIDFTSGTIMTLRFPAEVDQTAVRQAFADIGHPEAVVQRTSEGDYLVRTRPFENVTTESADDPNRQTERAVMIQSFTERFGSVEVLGFDFVSPLIAQEIVRHSVLAVGAACVGILLYLWWAFRRVPQSWRYGACAVFALVHDALLVLGVFSILGRLFNVELDALFITAVLTVIGFSVHDTIVVFDRIRENIIRHQGEAFESVVNHSLTQTLARSLNTSITVLLTLITLRLFGGVTIHNFVLALLVGITSGTYSSIFNASLLLVSWETGEIGRFWRRLTLRPATA
ncbi:MAG TPA: protein translocase subunit SecF [Chloroflexota bacterium]|nr:protein translocase subunit SecF [Chloroflexota bacterium]